MNIQYIDIQCPLCGFITVTSVTSTEYVKLKDNIEPIHKIFPNKSATYRELFISHLCEACQNNIFR